MSFSDEDWDTLIWCVVSPQAGRFKEIAMEEMVRRAGTEEEAAEIVKQRIALGVPIGALQDWAPPWLQVYCPVSPRALS